MDRLQKEQLVAELNGFFGEAESVVIGHYQGLSVAEITELRAKAREHGASIRVTKNRLTRLALKDTPYEGLTDHFTGPTIMAWSDSDPVAAAKAMNSFAKDNNKLALVAGAMGTEVLDVNGVKALASMPSLDELRAKLIGTIQAPAQKVAAVSQAPAKKLAMVFKAYAEKGVAA
ncbi:MAG: 50S ribosomal protein L10 [Alphaproteobacteria bacterium]